MDQKTYTVDVSRLTNGRELVGHQFRVSDVIGYLSGVNYGSVVKVLAALNALERYVTQNTSGVPEAVLLRELIEFSNVPTSPVRRGDVNSSSRIVTTRDIAMHLVRSGYTDPYEDIINARGRLGEKGGSSDLASE